MVVGCVAIDSFLAHVAEGFDRNHKPHTTLFATQVVSPCLLDVNFIQFHHGCVFVYVQVQVQMPCRELLSHCLLRCILNPLQPQDSKEAIIIDPTSELRVQGLKLLKDHNFQLKYVAWQRFTDATGESVK